MFETRFFIFPCINMIPAYCYNIYNKLSASYVHTHTLCRNSINAGVYFSLTTVDLNSSQYDTILYLICIIRSYINVTSPVIKPASPRAIYHSSLDSPVR